MMQLTVATPSFRAGSNAGRETLYQCGCIAFNLAGRGFPRTGEVDVTCTAHCLYTCARCSNPCAVLYVGRYCLPCAESVVPDLIN